MGRGRKESLRDAEQKATDNAKHCEVERDEERSSEFRLSEISENKNLNKTVSQMMNLRWRKTFIESLILAQDERWRRA